LPALFFILLKISLSTRESKLSSSFPGFGLRPVILKFVEA
jgi:hypothetical protein